MFRRDFNYYFVVCYRIMEKLRLPPNYDYLDVSQENDDYIFRIKQIKDEPSALQHEGYFGTDLVHLSCGEMTTKTPELAPPLQTSSPHEWEDI
ncbi:hypothetical protein AVEN_202865-1 [Araneus ventricosus]|uniref:Uncharacterized protein n=1 Tax=Araneus ventricosus TaxID=182803 RepID=A0A4Y2UT09_ARAVE|nr:hypothetical protein AVEN_202865-1 [Araneus ventricosus]